jgi:hypothetical protein
MAAISANIITAEPTLDALAEGVAGAARRVEDFDGRVRGGHVRWSRSWSESFDDELMERVEGFLRTG